MQTKPTHWDELFNASHKTEYKFDITDVGSYYSGDIIGTPVITKPLLDEPAIGRVCTGSLDMTVTIKSGVTIPKAAQVKAYCRLRNPEGTLYTDYIPQGIFYIKSREQNARGDRLKISCLDGMIKTGATYLDKTAITAWPQSMATIAADIAAIVGVQLDYRTVLKNYSVSKPDRYLLMSEVLRYIAAAHGGSWIMTEGGTLRLIPLASASDPVQQLGGAHTGYTSVGQTITVSNVILKSTSASYAAGNGTGRTLTADCMYAAQSIADALCGDNGTVAGVVYEPYNVDCAYLDPCAELGDTIEISTAHGGVHSIVLQTIKMSCTTACTCGITANTDEEIADEYPYLTQSERVAEKVNELAAEVGVIAEDYVPSSKVDSVVDSYLGSEQAGTKIGASVSTYLTSDEGKASVILACEGEFVTPDGLTGEIRAGISAEVSGEHGIVRTYVEGQGYMTTSAADGTYIAKTELSASIESYIDTSAGKAQIVSACAGTYQTLDGMDSYVKSYTLGTSIGQYIDGATGTAKIVSACAATYQTQNAMKSYATSASVTQEVSAAVASITLAVSSSTSSGQTNSTFTLRSGSSTLSSVSIASTTATQAATIAADAVKGIALSVSSSTSSGQTNTTFVLKSGSATLSSVSIHGTTATQAATIAADAVKGITLSVSNAASSSTLTLKSGTATLSSATITFTGQVVFKSDLSTSGSTVINGANITAGKISAKYIDVTDLRLTSLYVDEKKAISGMASTIYIGGDTYSATFSNVYIKASSEVNITSWSNSSAGLSIDLSNKVMYPNSSASFSLGTSLYPFSDIYSRCVTFGDSYPIVVGYYDYKRVCRPRTANSSYPTYLGESGNAWHYCYVTELYAQVSASIGTNTSSKVGFFGTAPIARQTLSTSTNNMSYTAASSTNYLYILNNLVGILKKHGLIL